MAYREQARARGLNDQTIEALLKEYESIEELLTIRDEDMNDMNIKKGQQGFIRQWVKELKAAKTGTAQSSSERTEPKASTSRSTSESTDIENLCQDVRGTAQSSSERTEPKASTSRSTSESTDIENLCQDVRGLSQRPNVEEITQHLDARTRNEVLEYFKQHGVSNLGKFFTDKLKEYRNVPVKIAVLGQAGVGKSSFINVIRDLSPEDVGAAAVGVKETTKKIKSYPDPRNTKLVYYDVPGMGTPAFPKDNYLETVRYKDYDFFLIVTCTRFREDDLYLAQQVKKLGKPYFLLRTKIDLDISNDKRDHPTSHKPDRVMRKVKQDCVENLRKYDLPSSKVFLISNCLDNRTQFDFPKLMEDLFTEAPEEKKTAVVLSLTAFSLKGIEAKKSELKKRIKWVAIKAATWGTFTGNQAACINKEVELYVEQFGLTKRHIQRMGVELEDRQYKQLNVQILSTGEETSKFIIATIVITKVLAFTSLMAEIYEKLKEALNKCEQAAVDIVLLVQKQ